MYLDFKSFAEVDRLTIPEYELLMKAVQIKQVNDDYRNHLQAFLNFAVKAEKKKGKHKTEPVYKKFIQFFNYEKRLKEVEHGENLKNENIENKNSRLSKIGKLLNKNKGE